MCKLKSLDFRISHCVLNSLTQEMSSSIWMLAHIWVYTCTVITWEWKLKPLRCSTSWRQNLWYRAFMMIIVSNNSLLKECFQLIFTECKYGGPLGRRPGRVAWKYPCKISTGILVESRWDPGEILDAGIFFPGGNLAGIPARFLPGSEISPGSCCESCHDSRREAKILAAKILARSCCKSHQDSRQEAIIPAAKIWPESYRESRQGSRREANSRWQKSRCDLAGNFAKIGDGKRNSWWHSLRQSRKNFRNAAANFFWIEPNMFTCLRLIKIQTKVS